MKLIFGLGNPGKSYEKTRHNVGFLVIDEIARIEGLKLKTKDLFLETSFQIGKEKVVLVKPTCFMNQSGEAVCACLERSSELRSEDVLIVLDDVNLSLGRLRFRASGSAGGHHGLESIIGALGTNRFPRLRIGVGRKGLAGQDLTNYVLGKFEESEWLTLKTTLLQVKNACYDWVSKGPQFVMNQYNRNLGLS